MLGSVWSNKKSGLNHARFSGCFLETLPIFDYPVSFGRSPPPASEITPPTSFRKAKGAHRDSVYSVEAGAAFFSELSQVAGGVAGFGAAVLWFFPA